MGKNQCTMELYEKSKIPEGKVSQQRVAQVHVLNRPVQSRVRACPDDLPVPSATLRHIVVRTQLCVRIRL